MGVPTVGVLWFAGVAMKNQQLATRQRLMDAYRGHLDNIQQQIQADWQRLVEQLDAAAETETAQSLFARALKFDHVDSVVCYQDGKAVYPALSGHLHFQTIQHLPADMCLLPAELGNRRCHAARSDGTEG